MRITNLCALQFCFPKKFFLDQKTRKNLFLGLQGMEILMVMNIQSMILTECFFTENQLDKLKF